MAQCEILVVANDCKLGALFNELFSTAGYTCVVANDACEGLEAFRRSRPALIVTDVNLPLHTLPKDVGKRLYARSDKWYVDYQRGGSTVREGIKLFQKIREEDPDIAVITTSANQYLADECLRAGADAFLEKSFDADSLLIAAERALERRQLLIERRKYQQAYGPLVVAKAHRDVLIVGGLLPEKVAERTLIPRDILEQVFVSAGYQCLLAGDGDEGLEVFRRSRPPLLVTDITNMPGTNGTELVQRVRLEDPDAAVVVLARAADVKAAIECVKLGAHAFVTKPVSWEELLIVKLGAHAFVTKPVSWEELLIVADRALERRQLLIERRQYRELL